MIETKEPDLQQVHGVACQHLSAAEAAVDIHTVEAAELDKMWRVVGQKAPQRW